MITNDVFLRARLEDWNRCVALMAIDYSLQDGLKKVIGFGQLTFTQRTEEHAEYVQPTLSLTMTAAQTLMDDLWLCGIRPSEGTGSAGQLAATQKHLEDIKKLLFKKEGIKL